MRITLTFILACTLFASMGQTTHTIQHDGITRGYELYVPTSWTQGQSLPLVFVLHGTTQTGAGIMDISGFNALAEAHGFIAVYPNGIGGSWNTGLVGASTADDMGLVDALIAVVEMQYGVDQDRVYSCGFSAGGYMSHRLACESPRCFAAIASVAGTMIPSASASCAPQRPVSVMQIHGTSDFVVAYGGGAVGGLGAEEVIGQWNAFNGCPSAPVITALPNINLLDLSTVERYDWSPCEQGTANVLLKVNGGGHQWPGTSALLGGIGTINRDIDASAQIWEFFDQHTCSSISTGWAEHGSHFIQPFFDSEDQQVVMSSADRFSEFTLYDTMGKCLRRGRIQGTTLSMPGLNGGMYVLQLTGGRNVVLRFQMNP